MKQFRGKEVIGWRVVQSENKDTFELTINKLMDKYEFEDFQFSVKGDYYVATILIANKIPTLKSNIIPSPGDKK